MAEFINTIDKKGEIYEIYNTNNRIIKMLTERFLVRIETYLKKIRASEKKGLDIGCGEGHMIKRLHEKGLIGELKAVDLDEERVAYAVENFPLNNVDYLVDDVYNLTLKDHDFDYVVATEILEHLPNPQLAIQNLAAHCKRDAYFIISVPFEPYFHWGNMLRGKHWQRGGKTPSHLNFWNHREFLQLLNQYFTVEEQSTFKSFPWMVFLCKMLPTQ